MSDSKPIRVAQIMGKLWAGGVENVVFNYYREIDKSKVQFDFYYDSDSTVEPPQELIDMGARFIEIPPYQRLPKYIRTLRKLFRKNNYHIVHSHINTLSVFPLFVAWTCYIPVRIAHNHSVPGGNELKRNVMKNILRCFSKVFSTHYFSCSEKAGRWLFGDKEFDRGSVFVVKNAIDFNKFASNQNEINELKRSLKLENTFVVGHIGRFTFAKNHQRLLEVFAELCKKRPDARLLLVGDGELHKQIIHKIFQLNIENKVVLVGQVSNPEKYYRIANVIVLPSIFEGLSLTTIESQISEVPVVVSKAIPDEAVISNGVVYAGLEETNIDWVEKIIKASEISVELDDRAKEYNISKKATILCKWYCDNYRKG